MSLTHVLSDVPLAAIIKLYHNSVFEETTDTDLIKTSMSFEIKPPVQDQRGPASRHLVPRLYLRTLKVLYRTVSREFSLTSCVRISELYAAGLGLPLDARLSSFWRCFAYGDRPEYGGNIVSYEDILFALKQHIQQAISNSPDGLTAYMSNVQKHYAKYTSMFSVKDSNIENAIKTYNPKSVFVGPNLDGRDTLLVYRTSSAREGYRLYGAFLKENSKFVPFLKQACSCGSIPSKLSAEVMPYVGTYVVVTGKTVLNAKAVKELSGSRLGATKESLFSDWLDQDLSDHKDCVVGLNTEQREASRYLSEKKIVIRQAQDLVDRVTLLDTNGRRVKKSNRIKCEKAKSFLSSVHAFTEIVKDRKKQESTWRKDANIGQRAKFYAFDMFIDDNVEGVRFVRAGFINIQKQFKRMGISALPIVEIKVGSTKTLKQRAMAVVQKVKGVPHTGVIVRTCDNKTVNQNTEQLWYKL